MSDATHSRSPWRVTLAVWHALFLRETLARLFGNRMAWFWVLAEPAIWIGMFVLIRVVLLGRIKLVYNTDFLPWMITGMTIFLLFRNNMTRSAAAITSNKSLFAYSQVKPVDTVLVRCFLEGMIISFIFVIFILLGQLLDVGLIPDFPLMALVAWLSLWCLGLGVGLIFSVITRFAPELNRIISLLTLPLMLLSGVMKPIYGFPHWLQQYLLYNPIVHGVESFRLAYFEHYYTLSAISLTYLGYWVIGTLTLGLALHLRFQMKLKAE